MYLEKKKRKRSEGTHITLITVLTSGADNSIGVGKGKGFVFFKKDIFMHYLYNLKKRKILGRNVTAVIFQL